MAQKKDFKKSAADLFISDTEQPAQEEQVTEEDYPLLSFKIPKGYRLVPIQKTERLQLLVSKDTKAGITAAAKEKGVSINSFINEVLENYLEGMKK